MIRDESWETMREGFEEIGVPKIFLPKYDIDSAVILGVT